MKAQYYTISSLNSTLAPFIIEMGNREKASFVSKAYIYLHIDIYIIKRLRDNSHQTQIFPIIHSTPEYKWGNSRGYFLIYFELIIFNVFF